MSAATKPRDGSPADIAIKAIAAHGKSMDEFDLAIAMDCTESMVSERLAYAIRVGAIVRSKFGNQSFYKIGSAAASAADEPPPSRAIEKMLSLTQPMLPQAPAPAPAPATASAPAPVPAKAPAPVASAPAQQVAPAKAALQAANDATVEAVQPAAQPFKHPRRGQPVDRIEVPQFTNPRTWVPSGGEADLPGEAGRPDGVDIDAAHVARHAVAETARPTGAMQPPIRAASAVSLPTVERFDCAVFAGGRLLLEIDGVPYVLRQEHAETLIEFIEFARALQESRGA